MLLGVGIAAVPTVSMERTGDSEGAGAVAVAGGTLVDCPAVACVAVGVAVGIGAAALRSPGATTRNTSQIIATRNTKIHAAKSAKGMYDRSGGRRRGRRPILPIAVSTGLITPWTTRYLRQRKSRLSNSLRLDSEFTARLAGVHDCWWITIDIEPWR